MKFSPGDQAGDMLTVVIGFTELVLQEQMGSLDPRQEEALRNVLEAALKLQDILEKNPPLIHD